MKPIAASAGVMPFEWAGTRRFLFLAMAVYTATAFTAVLWIPKGAGEAGAGPGR